MNHHLDNFPGISRLTLGTVALGMNYGVSNTMGQPARETSLRIIETAVKLGINTLDTARHYGEAENIIGDYYKRSGQNPFNLVTKFRISNENLLSVAMARKEAYESIGASLAALQTKPVEVALFHKRPGQPLDLLLKVLPPVIDELCCDGLIRQGGISVYHPAEVDECLGIDQLQVIQVPINILDQRLIQDGSLGRLSAAGKTVFARSIYLQGLLLTDVNSLGGDFKESIPYLNQLRELAELSGMSVAQMAFSFVRDTPGIASIIFGALGEDQVRHNVDLLAGPALLPEVREMVEFRFKNLPERLITPALWATQ